MEQAAVGLTKWWAKQNNTVKLWWLVAGVIATLLWAIIKLVGLNSVLQTRIDTIAEKFRTEQVDCEQRASALLQIQRNKDDSVLAERDKMHIQDLKDCDDQKRAFYLSRYRANTEPTERIKSVLK